MVLFVVVFFVHNSRNLAIAPPPICATLWAKTFAWRSGRIMNAGVYREREESGTVHEKSMFYFYFYFQCLMLSEEFWRLAPMIEKTTTNFSTNFFVVFFSPNFSIAKTICTNFIHVHHPRYPGGRVLAPGCIFKGVVRLSSLILILRKSKGTLRAGVDDIQASRNFPRTVSNNSGYVNREF